ncbi:MAG TPA: sigma-70 family RNA polymerase sigma factor [Anaerolineales bacterium]|nr:sigma-70 family RNA polymerase sigma factor [Anaerolineales bacterium]
MTTSPHQPNIDYSLRLTAALQGSADEFNALTEPHRRELRVHCYRILGSLTEAEDMVQETFLHAWRRLSTFEGRSSFRAWLYKIATNACLDALDKRRTRRLLPVNAVAAADPYSPIAPPPAEISWLEPFPDEWLADQAAANPETHYSAYESVSLAFLAALQTLPPRQRAVLILSDVLDWSAQEMADLLGTSPSAVASALRRARVTMAASYHGRSPEDNSARPPDPQTRQLLDRYVHAWQTADVDGLVDLLREDAVMSMPPFSTWYQGRPAIREFTLNALFADGGMFKGKAAGRWRLVPTAANRQPAFAVYQVLDSGDLQPTGIQVLTFERGVLAAITCFLDPTLTPRFVSSSPPQTKSLE